MFIMHGRPFIWFPGWGKVISAQVCAEDVVLALIMTWTPVSAVSLLSPPACRLLTAKHVWIKQNQRDFNADIIGNELLTLQPFLSPSLIFCSFFSPSLLLLLLCYGWNQVIKHRLQRLLRPQKEERKSKPQTSTVAAVGLEEMKTKVQNILYTSFTATL